MEAGKIGQENNKRKKKQTNKQQQKTEQGKNWKKIEDTQI